MSEMVESQVPVLVHVVNQPDADKRTVPAGVTGTYNTFVLATAGTPVCILGHSPRRVRAVITVIGGAATDQVRICNSQADAQGNSGMVARDGMVLDIRTGDELWAVSAQTPTLGVAAEFAS